MKQTLQLKLSQHLALTPQLQQSIRLLQLSTLELNQEIEQMLADNPLLERLDDPLDGAVRLAADGGLEAPGAAPSPLPADGAPTGDPDAGDRQQGDGLDASSPGSQADTAPGERDDRGDADPSGLDGGLDWGADRRNRDDDDDERARPQLAAAGISLQDHLLQQLAATHIGPRDRALVRMLVDELDANGWLTSPVTELHALLPEELEVDLTEMRAALRLLQSFDPPGVGAHDLAECLGLQLAVLPRRQWPSVEGWEAACRIAAEHLPLLAARDWTRLKRALRIDDETLRDAQALIRSLQPHPGVSFGTQEATFVVPDVIVRRTGNGWIATLNPDVMPRLRVNDMYARILRRSRGAAGLSAQLQEARWMIKNVQQRFDTILRVSQAIVDRQRAFFTHGEVAMRPLVLREIAEILGLHESTVSRVTTQKFMLTPSGTFELKYFFGSHVATDSGGAASSTAIRALIKQLVAAEDSRQPLSDSRIAELLGEQGIVVARRTVAKYRESLRIPAVAQRKAL